MKRRETFKATCDRCCNELPCLTVVLKIQDLAGRHKELANYCAACRRNTHGKWEWPVPTSKDKGEVVCDELAKKGYL